MAGIMTARLARSPPWLVRSCRIFRRFDSTDAAPPAPALLLKLRNDLKTAMREKDRARLDVLRGLLAEVTNANKTKSPIKTDMQVLSILRKKASASRAAAEEFESAGRSDLKDKEDAQISILDTYAGSVQLVSDDEIREAVTRIKAELSAVSRADKSSLLKRLIGPGGEFADKAVDKAAVARIAQEALSA